MYNQNIPCLLQWHRGISTFTVISESYIFYRCPSLLIKWYIYKAFLTPNTCVHTVTVTLLRAEVERADSCPTNTDVSSATAVGLIIGSAVAGALGVLLIEGIVCGACRLRRTKHQWVQ